MYPWPKATPLLRPHLLDFWSGRKGEDPLQNQWITGGSRHWLQLLTTASTSRTRMMEGKLLMLILSFKYLVFPLPGNHVCKTTTCDGNGHQATMDEGPRCRGCPVPSPVLDFQWFNSITNFSPGPRQLHKWTRVWRWARRLLFCGPGMSRWWSWCQIQNWGALQWPTQTVAVSLVKWYCSICTSLVKTVTLSVCVHVSMSVFGALSTLSYLTWCLLDSAERWEGKWVHVFFFSLSVWRCKWWRETTDKFKCTKRSSCI